MAPVFVVDNYDSFTYNLVHQLEALGAEVTVKRNDCFPLGELEAFSKILLSPGPGIPEEAGQLKAVIERYAPTHSILGICLGHQAIAEVFGGQLENLTQVYHGLATPIQQTVEDPIFTDLPKTLEVGRYHSWVVAQPLPNDLEILALDEKQQIMALRHKQYDLKGLQFHPESVLTPLGEKILENWLHS
ncbi:MAG: anthranilate synthase component II [Flavobacteriaceae bacterium]